MNFNNVRIALKYADLAAWEASSLVLNAGELAIAVVPVGESFDVMFKVGNGSKTFKELEWAYSSKVGKDELATTLAGYYTEAEVDTLIAGCVSDSEWEEHIEAFKALSETVAGLHNYNDAELRQLIAEEITRATGAERDLGKRIDDEIARATEKETANALAINVAQGKADQAYELASQKTTMGEVEAKDYATKAEAQGYANAKDAAITAAQNTANQAKAAIDAFLNEEDLGDAVVNTLKEIQAGLDAGEDSAASLLLEINKIKDGTTIVPKAADADTLDGKHAAEFATAGQGAKADSAIQEADLTGAIGDVSITKNEQGKYDVQLRPASVGSGELAAEAVKVANIGTDVFKGSNGVKVQKTAEGITYSIDENAEWIFNCGGAN